MRMVFFKQKTAYEMRISDWSSDACSSDLGRGGLGRGAFGHRREPWVPPPSLPLPSQGEEPRRKLAAEAAPTGGVVSRGWALAGVPRGPGSADPPVQQIRELVRVLLLLREDFLEDALGGGVALADVVDHLAIAVDRDALGSAA